MDTSDGPSAARPGRDAEEGSAYDIVLLERVALGARVQPAIAVGLALGAICWLALSATSWIALRFFLSTLAAVVGGVTAWVLTLNRGRPDRSIVRPADLPVRLAIDVSGVHLVEERGAKESVRWTAPHAVAVWTDPTGRPLCLRVANQDVTWTLVGGLGESAPPGMPTIRLSAVVSAYARTDALARRHAPWEAILSIGEGHDVLGRLHAARADAGVLPLWRIPLDAEFDPTARWSLRLRPNGLASEHGGETEDDLDLTAPFSVRSEWIEAAVLPGTPPRLLRRFDIEQGDTRLRFAVDPGAVRSGGGPLHPVPGTLPHTDQPRLVPPEWAPVLLAHLDIAHLDSDGDRERPD